MMDASEQAKPADEGRRSSEGLGLAPARWVHPGDLALPCCAAFEHPISDEARIHYVPLYDQAALAAAVAAERERCASLCDSETVIQHGEFGAGWVQGAKACADLIRET